MRKESLKKDGNKNGTSDADADFDALFTQERRPSRDQRRSTMSSTPTNSNGDSNGDGAPAAGDKSTTTAADDSLNSGGVAAESTPMAATTTKAARKHISYADDCKSSDGSASDAAENKDESESATAPDAAATTDDDTAADPEQQDYEVEDIVAHKLKGKRLLFQVRWKNYTPADDTWEPEAALDCPEIIERYRAEHPDAVGKPPKVKKPKKGKEMFDVEEIVGHRIERKRNVFLIRWKGFTAEQDTWEKEDKLSCPELLQAYKEAHQATLVDTVKKAKGSPKRSASERAAAKKERAERDYEVQAIVAKGAEGGHTLYQVRWKGYSAGSDTWEREENLNCPELIAKFEQQQSAKRPVSMRGAKERTAAAAYEEDGESEDEVMPSKKRRSQAAAGEEDYEVERIVDVKTERGKKVYLVKWKGWPASSNTWEPLASLSCADLLKKFEQSTKKSSKTVSKTPLSKAARKSHTPAPATPRGRGRPPAKSAAAATTPRARGRPSTKSKVASPVKKSPVKTAVAKSPRAASHSSLKKKKVAVAKTPAVTARGAGRKAKSAKKTYADDDDDADVDVDPLAVEPDWEVEKIVSAKNNRDGSRMFLIRWKGCKPSQDTWEPEENVDCPQLVKEFTSKQKATATASKTKKSKK